MNPSVKVSVVIPVFNGRDHIMRALDSVAAQSFQDWEIVVVDDGSTDDTSLLVSAHSDQRIRLVQQSNAGPSSARNTGVRIATGDYIAFLDADDYWSPSKLEEQLSALGGHRGARWAYSSAVTVNTEGTIIEALPAEAEGQILNQIILRNCVTGSASSVIVARETLVAAGGFDPQMGYAEDWALWARLAAMSPVVRSRPTGVFIRRIPKSYGSDPAKMRDDSLRFLEAAFGGFATDVKSLRPQAIAWVHFLAGVGFREQGDLRRAIMEFLSAASHRPGWSLPYRGLWACRRKRRRS